MYHFTLTFKVRMPLQMLKNLALDHKIPQKREKFSVDDPHAIPGRLQRGMLSAHTQRSGDPSTLQPWGLEVSKIHST